jgi:acyl dehydratase
MNPEHADLVAPRMSVGDTARRTRTVSARDIELFTEMTGDRNPLHYSGTSPAAAGSAASSCKAA